MMVMERRGEREGGMGERGAAHQGARGEKVGEGVGGASLKA